MDESTQLKLFAIARSLIGVGSSSRRDDFLHITEGRDHWKPAKECPPGTLRPDGKCSYSWCGDYVTYCCYVVGVIDGKLLNRKAINGKWFEGQNLTMIENWSRSHGVWHDRISDCNRAAIYVQKRGAGDHIGFVEGRNGDNYMTLDGNSIGAVVASQVKQLTDGACRGFVFLDDLPVQGQAQPVPGQPPTPVPQPIPVPAPGIENLPFPIPLPSGIPGLPLPLPLPGTPTAQGFPIDLLGAILPQLQNSGQNVLISELPRNGSGVTAPWFPGAGVPGIPVPGLPFPNGRNGLPLPPSFDPSVLFGQIVGSLPIPQPTDGLIEEAMVSAMDKAGTLAQALMQGGIATW